MRNLTTADPIDVSGDQITIETSAEKLSYQGALKRTDLPWNISLRYFMDGAEYPAQDIAGSSGALEIRIGITQNGSVDSLFYDDFALQVSLNLNAETSSNIVADGATIANAGGDKQISYIVLPGKGADLSVFADVTDFEMDGLSLAGVSLSLPIDFDKSELTDQIAELQDAIVQLDDGAGELADGAHQLSDGTGELADGAQQISDGASLLAGSVSSLTGGVADLQDGLAQLSDGLTSLEAGAQTLQSGMESLSSQSSALTGASSQILTALDQIATALDGFSTAGANMNELTNGSSQVKSGLTDLVNGIASLQAAFGTYDSQLASAGLSASALSTGNAAAVDQINNTLIPALQAQRQQIIDAGGDTSAVDQQIAALGDIADLLTANSGLITADADFLSQLKTGIDALYGTSSSPGAAYLLTQYEQLDAAIQALPQMLDSMQSGLDSLKAALITLTVQFAQFDGGINAYTNGYEQIVAGYQSLSAAIGTLADGSGQLVDGMAVLKNGTDALQSGAGTFAGQMDMFASGAADLNTGAGELANGLDEYKDGTTQFRDETSDMDEKMEQSIDDIIGEITGGSGQMSSFVSQKNTNVSMVQFVMKTSAIKAEEAQTTIEDTTPEPTFWDKLLLLFGL